MKATITDPTSTKAEFSVAHSRREKDRPPFSVNLSMSQGLSRTGTLHFWSTHLPCLSHYYDQSTWPRSSHDLGQHNYCLASRPWC